MKHVVLPFFLLFSALFLLNSSLPTAVAAPPDDLILTGIIDGPLSGGVPKAVELYVVNDIADLSIYGLGSANNGGGTDGQEFTFPAVAATAGDFLYVASESPGFTNFFGFAPDYTSSAMGINGDDAIELFTNGSVSDVFGDINIDGTGEPWEYLDGWAYRVDGTGPDGTTFTIANWTFSGINALDGETSNGSATTPFPIGTYSPGGGGDVPPTVTSTSPNAGAVDVSLASNITINFSEPVDATAGAFTLECPAATPISFSVTPNLPSAGNSFTLDPDSNLPENVLCEVTAVATNITDQDGTPDNMAADYSFSFTTTAVDPCLATFTPIYDIQGNGATTPIPGTVTTQGVVVGDYEGTTPNLRGFYLQDLLGDGDPTTSDGIFVFNGDNNNVSLGDVVRVTGTAGEFQDQTQISNVTSIIPCGTDTITPVDITLPFATADYLERYEGMLVRLPQTLYVTENYRLGRFGQVTLTAHADGRLPQPTNFVLPGAPALALAEANSRNQIIIDDTLNSQNEDPIVWARGGNPLSAANTLRGGDSVTDIVGVLTYSWGGDPASPNAYRVRPLNALDGGMIHFQATNPRPATPPAVGGTLKVASFNVLNYFNTFTGCTAGVGGVTVDCRGADNIIEFDRQEDKIVAALLELDADIVGLMEIENDGYGAFSAIQRLVDALNAEIGSFTYTFVDVDAFTLEVNALGTDAIKVGLIYKPATVSMTGTTAVLDSIVDANFDDSRNRPMLLQSFTETATGEIITVAVNHLKSKGSSCATDTPSDPDMGDGQGNCNLSRTNAAQAIADFLATDPTGVGSSNYLVMGDLNSYAMEDPIRTLETAGYTNLARHFGSTYGFQFDGQWGTLDYAMANAALFPFVTGAAEWHINADEPISLDYNTEFKTPGHIISLYSPDAYRASDHDPVIVGLNLLPNQSSLPASYGLAWHTGDGELRLGSAWVIGSDIADDDGVAIGAGSGSGGQWQDGANGGSLDIIVTDATGGSATGCLYGWIDWNQDGVFDDPAERVIDAETGGSGNYSFTVPDDTFDVPGTEPPTRSPEMYNMRVRLYETCASSPTGMAIGGEVEDLGQMFSPTAVSLTQQQQTTPSTASTTLWLIAGVLTLTTAFLLRRRTQSYT